MSQIMCDTIKFDFSSYFLTLFEAHLSTCSHFKIPYSVPHLKAFTDKNFTQNCDDLHTRPISSKTPNDYKAPRSNKVQFLDHVTSFPPHDATHFSQGEG